MRKITAAVRNFVREDEGASMVEYALLVALIAVVIMVAAEVLGTKGSAKMASAASKL